MLTLFAIAAATYIVTHRDPLIRHPIVALRLLRSDAPATLPVPVRGVRAPQLRNTWGAPRSGGRGHQGIDIFAPRGREIVSTTRGIVVTVGESKLGGRIVRVFGPGGYWHYYAHLERFGDIRVGDVIAEGAVIGYVGDSGNAKGTPPHLHYGIYRFRGGAVNPYDYLRSAPPNTSTRVERLEHIRGQRERFARNLRARMRRNPDAVFALSGSDAIADERGDVPVFDLIRFRK